MADVAGPKVCPTCGTRYPTDTLFCPSDGAPLQTAAAQGARGPTDAGVDPYVGRELAGHIEVRQLAGVGAMGRVYRAFQKGIDRDVAVKVLHRELSTNPQLVTRFHREAKVASRLQHPNVVQVHLAGQLPDGALYIVMEYLDGLSLQSALAAAGGAVPLPRALHIALQVCDAVGEAHAQGITHRDLKPENVMLVHRGEDTDFVKVLDFGIARLEWGEQSIATAAGLIFGTARYISPEGAQGEPVGPGGDVYSIAMLLYQMLAGRTPFDGDQAVAMLIQQIHEPAPPLRSVPRSSYVPEPIAAVIEANLAKDKAERAPDARAFGRALLAAAKAGGLSAEDLVPRSILLGARPPEGVLQLSSMQKTKQLSDADLPRAIKTEIAANEPTRTAYQVPDPSPHTARSSRPDGSAAQPQLPMVTVRTSSPSHPDMATQKYASPVRAELDDTIDTPPPSQVDATMNDASDPIVLPSPSQPNMTARMSPGVAPTMFDDVTVPAMARGGGSATKVGRLRWGGIVLLCFLVGIGGAMAVAYRLQLLGTSATAAPEAIASFSAPSALVLTPGRLGPAATPLGSPGPRAPAASSGAAVVGLAPAPAARAVAPEAPLRTTMALAPAKPRVGQPMDIVAKVTAGGAPLKKPADDAHFTIAGNSIGEEGIVQLTAFTDDGSTYRATFTFLAPGKYEVTFHAKSDASLLKASRSVVTLDSPTPIPATAVPAPPEAPPAPPPAPAAAPSASVKWL